MLALAALLAILPITHAMAATPGKLTPPRNGMIKVAVVLSKHATVIDFAGPWEVFQDTSIKDGHGNDISPFELYTVAPTKEPLHTSGSNHAGLTITPDYSFADAPIPDIVVIGAQMGGPGLTAWLRKVHADHKIIMSVCTGAFELAKTGLLHGKEATTHHWYFGNFAHEFPDVKLVRQVRYAQASPIIFSAGGLSSGIDLALHLVADYFGQTVAQKTADYMEYLGTGWKSNQGISELTTPVTRVDWSGKFAPDHVIVLHIVTRGASPALTTDIPAQNVTAAATTFNQDGKKLSLAIDIPGHPTTFTAQVNPGADKITGTFAQDGKSYPLTLTKKPETRN
ncbi:MAG: DJ-1/PfpI family protein [Rhodanobacteraceae bacterium]